MTTTSTTTTTSTARGIAQSTAVAFLGAGLVNAAISFGARALGADPAAVPGLQLPTFLLFTLIGVLIGAIGWNIVRTRTSNPHQVLTWLVPAVVVVSLLADVAVAVAVSPLGGVALGLMHLAVTAVAVPTYSRFLPLPKAPAHVIA